MKLYRTVDGKLVRGVEISSGRGMSVKSSFSDNFTDDEIDCLQDLMFEGEDRVYLDWIYDDMGLDPRKDKEVFATETTRKYFDTHSDMYDADSLKEYLYDDDFFYDWMRFTKGK